MVNYANTKIYKIYSHIGPKIYIGSTTKEYLSQRMTGHRRDYDSWKNNKHNRVMSFTLFDEYGIDNCMIELIEAKSCMNKDESCKLEGSYIRKLECVNKVIPDRTKAEYYKDNLEHIKHRTSEHRKTNKEQYQISHGKSNQKYRETHKEQLQKYRDENKKILYIRKQIHYQSIQNKQNTFRI